MRISQANADRLKAIAREIPSGDAIRRSKDIAKDSLHQLILDGLEGRLDPGVFEACAVDLLRKHFPGIIHVRDGGDDGFDGAIADGQNQEPFPLIVTTGKQPLGNLKRNLRQIRKKGWNPRRALFATSRRITPTMRRKLHDMARVADMELLHTLEQDWFASCLYHDSVWRKRLLGVTGNPHALSIYPTTKRPIFNVEVLGRDDVMQWLLEEGRGDCVLVGEPGSGKTFLLRALALQGKARFLIEPDRQQVANDIRSLRPPAIIVDDAHVYGDRIETLVQLRRELDADFRIIAVSWPGDAPAVCAALQVGSKDQYELLRIDADTMIEIIKSVGLSGSDELLRNIRKQAAGRPGLAMTLAHLCLVGDWEKVIHGEALLGHIIPDLSKVIGEDGYKAIGLFRAGRKFWS